MSQVVFFKQKTAYEMRISDWSSDVCSSDLDPNAQQAVQFFRFQMVEADDLCERAEPRGGRRLGLIAASERGGQHVGKGREFVTRAGTAELDVGPRDHRSEEHTSELQSPMRNSYAVCCLKHTKNNSASHDT